MTVQLGDCDKERCVLERGKTYDFEQKFKAPRAADNLKAIGTGNVFRTDIIVDSVGDDDACKRISRRDKKGEEGKVCPLKKDDWYVYKTQIKIRDNEIPVIFHFNIYYNKFLRFQTFGKNFNFIHVDYLWANPTALDNAKFPRMQIST